MYVQLAENYLAENYLAENNLLSQAAEKYIFVPAGFMDNPSDKFVREDFFDNLPEREYDEIMFQLMPYQDGAMDEMGRQDLAFIGKWAKNMKARKDERRELKTAKREAKISKKEAKADLIKSKGEAKIMKAEAQRTRAESGEPTGWQSIIEGAKGLIPGQKDLSLEIGTPKDEEKKGVPTWVYIAGAGVLGLTIFFATRKPKPGRR